MIDIPQKITHNSGMNDIPLILSKSEKTFLDAFILSCDGNGVAKSSLVIEKSGKQKSHAYETFRLLCAKGFIERHLYHGFYKLTPKGKEMTAKKAATKPVKSAKVAKPAIKKAVKKPAKKK